eukprot:Skav227168  [mRNA]  locus=scaffold502:403772:411279:- [translate_table: standard]
MGCRKALRLLRLLRLTRLQNKIMVLANRFLTTNAFLVLKVGAGLFMMIITNHIIACCWFGVGSAFDEEKNWIIASGLDKEDFGESYTASLHWSLTQFTPATQNITPDNTIERGLAPVETWWFPMGLHRVVPGHLRQHLEHAAHVAHYSKLFQFFNERNLSVNLYAKVKEVTVPPVDLAVKCETIGSNSHIWGILIGYPSTVGCEPVLRTEQFAARVQEFLGGSGAREVQQALGSCPACVAMNGLMANG